MQHLHATVALRTWSHSAPPELPMFHMSSFAWAFASRVYLNVPLRKAIAAAAMRTLVEAMPRSLTGISWSMSAWSMWDPPGVNATARAPLALAREFSVPQLLTLPWSVSRRCIGD
eukprot:NODE_17329_length_949_cov_3.671533.p3 GENE.NODE_17329_length_949_cov_3.671533~~NODE_17329_length_949_cov_3.671533.p3  ORF type:complete len:115 (-),score=18.40 NODE_17329_length_949_cov_3.671533:161-505(-)